jgi:hypothetical protein
MNFWVISLIVVAVVVVGWVATSRLARREELAARRDLRRLRRVDSGGHRAAGGYPYSGYGIGYGDGGGGGDCGGGDGGGGC